MSFIEQFGDVPKHWNLSRLGFEAWVRARLGWKGLKAEEYVDDGYAFLATPNIKGRDIDFENVNYITKDRYDESPEIKLKEGDVLLAKDGSTLGTVNIVRTLPREATVNSSIAVLTPGSRLNGLFLYYVFQSSYVEHSIQLLKGGMGVPHLFQDDLNKLPIPLPPISEQTVISSFLDRETAKIDVLVEEKQRLIELLEEKRQAVISHAVTRGLNPNVQVKTSDIEWLGAVPEHWEVLALKKVATVQTGLAKGKDVSDTECVEIPYLRVANVQDGHIDLSDVATIEVPAAEFDRYKLQKGDVLMNEGGDFDKLGRGHVWEGEIDPCIHQNHVFAVRPHSVLPYWLNLVTSSDYAQFFFMSRSKQSTNLASISSTNLMKLPVTVPPSEEQAQIVEFVHQQTCKLKALQREVQSAITLLKERRTALISAAVTGKIDVRGIVKADTTIPEEVAA